MSRSDALFFNKISAQGVITAFPQDASRQTMLEGSIYPRTIGDRALSSSCQKSQDFAQLVKGFRL